MNQYLRIFLTVIFSIFLVYLAMIIFTPVVIDIDNPVVEVDATSDKTSVVYNTDYQPWWDNQTYWPYYSRSHNWMSRYPYWRQPYYANYWDTPYYPSREVIVKPFLTRHQQKNEIRDQMAENFQKARVTA